WSASPRIEAAQGLPWLTLREKDDTILAAIEGLAKDKVPSVRFLISNELYRTSLNAPDFFWKTVHMAIENEENEVVLDAICNSMGRLIGKYEEESVKALKKIYDKIYPHTSHRHVTETLVRLVLWLMYHRKNKWAEEVAEEFIKDPITNSKWI